MSYPLRKKPALPLLRLILSTSSSFLPFGIPTVNTSLPPLTYMKNIISLYLTHDSIDCDLPGCMFERSIWNIAKGECEGGGGGDKNVEQKGQTNQGMNKEGGGGE